MNTLFSLDPVTLIGLKPVRDFNTNSEVTRKAHRLQNYAFMGLTFILIGIVVFLRWERLDSLDAIANLELSAFSPLCLMWGVGSVIQFFQCRGAIQSPDTVQRVHDESGKWTIHIPANDNGYISEFSLNAGSFNQDQVDLSSSTLLFVQSYSSQNQTPKKKKRGPKEKPRVGEGEEHLQAGIKLMLDRVFEELGCNLKASHGGAIAHYFKEDYKEGKKRFINDDYVMESLEKWLLETYRDHFDEIKHTSMSSSFITTDRNDSIIELIDRKYAELFH